MVAREKLVNLGMRSLVRIGCPSPHVVFTQAPISEKDVFKSSKVQVVGVSGDNVDKQKDFVQKHKLTVCSLYSFATFFVLSRF